MQRLLQKKKKKIRQQEEKVNWERGKGKGNLKVKLKWERNIESEDRRNGNEITAGGLGLFSCSLFPSP